MRVGGAVTGCRIGAAFRVEGRRTAFSRAPRPSSIAWMTWSAPDQDAVPADLRRQMAIAEMPGEPAEHGRGAGPHLDQRLQIGAHEDDSRRRAAEARRHPPAAPAAAGRADSLRLTRCETRRAPAIALLIGQGEGFRGPSAAGQLPGLRHMADRAASSEQEIALRHGQDLRRGAGEQHAIGAHLIGLGIDGSILGVASLWIMLALEMPAAGIGDRHQRAGEAEAIPRDRARPRRR